MNIQEISWTGVRVGLGVAIVPAALTSLIACSKIIFINIIADIGLRILTANTYTLSVDGISFVAVPLLWKASLVAAVLGGAMIALSLTAILSNSIYKRYELS